MSYKLVLKEYFFYQNSSEFLIDTEWVEYSNSYVLILFTVVEFVYDAPFNQSNQQDNHNPSRRLMKFEGRLFEEGRKQKFYFTIQKLEFKIEDSMVNSLTTT